MPPAAAVPVTVATCSELSVAPAGNRRRNRLAALCVKLSNPILRSGHGHLWGSLELGAATTGRLVDRAQGNINRVHLPMNHNQPLRCCARPMRSARSKQSAVGTPLASRYALRRAVDIASSSIGDASD